MGDEQLRRGERRWRASGAPEDEARYLRERLRAGRIDLVRLALAAECGHPGARQALGRRLDVALEPLRGLAARAERAGDDEARARAAVALAHALLGAAAAPLARSLAEAALVTTEEWLRCPCPPHLGHALRAWRALAPQATPGGAPSGDAAADLLRRAVDAVERQGLAARGALHLRVAWLPWLVQAAAR